MGILYIHPKHLRQSQICDMSLLLAVMIMLVGTSMSSVAAQEFKDGIYMVNADIEAGLYRVVITDKIMKMGYFERLSGVSMGFDDIIANDAFTGDGYAEIKDTDFAVRLQGIKITKVVLKDTVPNIKTKVSDGTYLIGYGLLPGLYKVSVTDTIINMGYIGRLRGVSMELSDIITNSILQGSGYVQIAPEDFAIQVRGGYPHS